MANTYERHDISDEFWAKIELLLPGREGIWGGNARDNRPFLNATFWIYERVHLGVICRRATAIGKILTDVFAVGATRESGNAFWRN